MAIKNFLKLKLIYLLLVLGLTTSAQAASLSLSTNLPALKVGELVTVNVLVNTAGQVINNASGRINFPTGVLEVVSVSKNGSIFSLWVEEPSFSNLNGIVNFEGGVPNPGFNGSAGKVLSIVFRAKRVGSFPLSLFNGSVRANDGLGTEVLDRTTGLTLTITEAPPAPVAKPSVATTTTATTTIATTSEETVKEMILPPATTSAPLIVVEGKSYGDILGKILIHYLTRPETVWVLLSIATLIIIILLIVIKIQRRELLRWRREGRQIRAKIIKKNNLTP